MPKVIDATIGLCPTAVMDAQTIKILIEVSAIYRCRGCNLENDQEEKGEDGAVYHPELKPLDQSTGDNNIYTFKEMDLLVRNYYSNQFAIARDLARRGEE